MGVKTWSLTSSEGHRLRVCENRVLRRLFGPKRDEVTEEWRKLHNNELHNLYSSPYMIRKIKSRRMRWAGHVARMEKSVQHFGGKALRAGDHSEDQGVDGRKLLEWILGEIGWGD
jgi:hypothetical protein